MSHYDDVRDFHRKFDLPTAETISPPVIPDKEVIDYRVEFLREELQEFIDACEADDLVEAADALIDLVYIAYGTALMLGIPPPCWDEIWNEVQRANMSKERATSAGDARSKRSNALDVVKPAGWVGPDGATILRRYGAAT